MTLSKTTKKFLRYVYIFSWSLVVISLFFISVVSWLRSQIIFLPFKSVVLIKQLPQWFLSTVYGREKAFVPTHEILVLIARRKLNLQTRMRSNPLGLHVWHLVRPFVYFHKLCVRTAKALARMRSLAWAFAVRLCDKYHNLMSWLICLFRIHYF